MVLLGQAADDLRELFIQTFVDTGCERYPIDIQQKHLHSDGWYYHGYLWDCMPQGQRITCRYAMDFLSSRGSAIYALWDIHTQERIFLPNYWAYPKEAVLTLSPSEVEAEAAILPEDCYFFDASLEWAIVLTHEESKPGKRICMLFPPLNGQPFPTP